MTTGSARKYPLILAAALLAGSVDARAQATSDSTRARPNTAAKKAQAKAPPTQPFGAEAFGASSGTTLRWLGMAGFLINSRGTTLMVDPLLEGFDMPVMIKFPIAAREVPAGRRACYA